MTIKQKYDLWVNEPKMPDYLKEELLKMDNTQMEEAFIKDLEFGTGGLRGIIGAGTNRMNVFTVRKTSLGFANYLALDPKNKKKGIAIAHDNRHFSTEFAKEVAEVFANQGFKVYLFKELRPTPMLSFAIRYYGCAGGVMLTASHNPKEYNGYKVYNASGSQLNLKESDLCIAEVNKVKDMFNIETAKDSKLIVPVLEEVEAAYFEKVKKIQINETSKSANILYSPLHGTGLTVVPRLLEEMGYNVLVYNPHAFVDPDFSNTKNANPESPEAWQGMAEVALNHDVDAIILTDPDTDRTGISVRDGNNYVLLNGNQGAALTVYYLLSQRKSNKKLEKNGYVYSTIVTSDLIGEIGKSFGQNSVRVLTGFKFIGEQALKIEGKAKFQFGCEEAIGSVIEDFVRDKDGVQQTLMYAEIASWLKDKGMTFIDYLHEIYEKYGYYLEYTHNLVLTGLDGAQKIIEIMDYVRANGITLKDYKLVKYEDYKESKVYFPGGKTEVLDMYQSNVLKFYFDNKMWVIFRPSGTEPKLKIYFSVVEKSQHDAEEVLNKVVREVLEFTNKI
ncbi:MAG TPA: phospho-sugar mutase [Acholeplasmataceae bacterium]|nr:phospho-sugar mutase [Acholeplasmataceae bacterium]